MEQDLSAFRPTRIWKRMPAERRIKAAEVFWADEQSTDQQVEAVTAIAAHMKFRTKSVISLPLERKARYLATLPGISETVAARALVSYHLEHQRPMMAAFLDALGIAHEDGLINEENVPAPDAERVRAAADTLAEKYPADDVSLYFSTLVSQDPETWGELAKLAQIPA
ncbi:MAG TPA: hypothetical protein VJ813_20315 [Vicinamibacterales bacterium]|nr:hypothetical protein [Vicinamibacterales bacterium]